MSHYMKSFLPLLIYFYALTSIGQINEDSLVKKELHFELNQSVIDTSNNKLDYSNIFHPNDSKELSEYLEQIKTCELNHNIIFSKSLKNENYKEALKYSSKELIFIRFYKNRTHNPITPCLILPDSTNKYGFYLITLEEFEKNPKSKNRFTWTTDLKDKTVKLYRKDCFDIFFNSTTKKYK